MNEATTVDVIEVFDAAHSAGIDCKVEAFSLTHAIVTMTNSSGGSQRFPARWDDISGWICVKAHLYEAIAILKPRRPIE